MVESPALSAEIRRFCQTTSVRGISRIVNSKSFTHSVIWLMGVLTCAGFLIWQIAVVFKRYRSYPVNTVFSESPKWDNTTFPDITICNLNSLVYEDAMSINYVDYVKTVKQLYLFSEFENIYHLFTPSNATIADDYQKILGYFISLSGYFLNFHHNDNSNIFDHSPIVDCEYSNWDYNRVPCNLDGRIEEIFDTYLYKCFTLKLNDTLRKNTRGFSAVLYVADILDNIWIRYRLDLKNTKAKGMKVLIHEPGTKPNMDLGIGIETGKSTTITMEQTKITRLPEPYSNCTAQKTFEPIEGSPTYTQAYCYDVCLQEQLLQQCGCIYNLYEFTDSQLERTNYTICGDLGVTNENSSINWKAVENILCAYNYSVDRGACAKSCPLQCVEYRSRPTIYANAWPHATSQLGFYRAYLSGASAFDEYSVVYDYNFINHTAALKILEKLDKDRLIQDNFLQLNIQFNSNDYRVEANVAAFSLDALGAQIGGVLSLWLGVTIMLIFELCELIVNISSAFCSVKCNQQTGARKIYVTKM